MLVWVGVPLTVGGAAFVALAAWLDAHGRRPPVGGRYDALVVAGCRVARDGRPSPALERRVRLAASLYHQGLAPTLVLTGGREPGRACSEAAAAAALCRELGVPEQALLLEEESRDTLGNAARSAALVTGRVLVVSCAAHTFRCRRMFARHFPRVDAAGAVPDTLRPRVRLALREAAAVLRHALQGRL